MPKLRNCLLLFVAAAALPSIAGSPAGDDRLERHVSLNFKKVNAAQASRLFAEMLKAERDLGVGFDQEATISLTLDHVKIRTCLNAFCESVGCLWELKPGDPPILSIDPDEDSLPYKAAVAAERRITLNLEEAVASQVFLLFSELLGTELSIGMPVEEGLVTIDRVDQPISVLLDEICLDLGCRWRLVEDGPIALKITAAES